MRKVLESEEKDISSILGKRKERSYENVVEEVNWALSESRKKLKVYEEQVSRIREIT